MSPAPFRLIVRTGPNPGMLFDLMKDVTVLGRDVANDIVLSDSEISRQHARLSRTPGGYLLEDLGSTNGTFVNGERLVAPRVLNHGDVIGLGENVTLSFESTLPEAAATVMGPAARGAARPAAARAPYPPPSPVPPAATPAPAEAAAPKKSRTWLFVGCGCLVLLAACALVLFFLPCEYYLPITSLFGYSYCP
ncbi:MAG: FHA domain-containing protein [Chloroflexota bacterium]